jgi:membrane protein implicated in regulation of membrane protease activity
VAWQAESGPLASHAMTVYWSALAFGGVLLLASLLGGHGHTDHDTGHADGHDDGHGADGDSAAHAALMLPFLSLRFWIFGLTFFGLTGAVLHGLGLATSLGTAVIASAMGLAMGYGAAQVFQTLARQTVGQIAADGGHVGREGKLLLPTARGQRGKMRVVVNGVTSDLLAETDEETPLPAGTTVLIVGMRGTVALVERSPTPGQSTEQGEQP